MANEKIFNGRLQFKRDIEANWNKAANFVPLKGEMIVYEVDSSHDKTRLKMGDGVTTVVNLPFFTKDVITEPYIDAVFNGYLNQVPLAIDTDGSIYNGTGFLEGYRLSSSGALKEQAGTVTTGFIKANKNDIIRMAGTKWFIIDGEYKYFAAYDENYNLLGTINLNINAANAKGWSNAGRETDTDNTYVYNENEVIRFIYKLLKNKDYAYIRISAMGKGEDMIVTKNESIPY